jgi:predicted nucleic acid-binding protein
MNGKLFFDTNVLVYAYDHSDLVKKNRAISLIEEGLNAGNAVISTQVLSEFFVTVTQKIEKKMSHKSAVTAMEYLAVMDIGEINLKIVLGAAQITERFGFSFWDALIIEAARTFGATTLYSEDMQDRQKIDRLTIRNPFL